MIRYMAAVFLMAVFFSCASKEGKNSGARSDSIGHSTDLKRDTLSGGTGYLVMDKDSLLIPAFTIELSLSQKANEKLNRSKETIIVAAWFSGVPKDTTSKEYAESGEMFLASVRKELSNSRSASFEGVKFSKAAYDSLSDKNISVLINVFSGRRTTQDNLLDCNILSEKMSAVRGRKFVLTGKLIGEGDSLQVK